MDPFTPILFFMIGSIAITMGSGNRYGIYGITAAISVIGALVTTLLLRFNIFSTVILSPWNLQDIFVDNLFLNIDHVTWSLALLLLFMLCMMFFASITNNLEFSSSDRAICMFIVTFCFLVLFAGNYVTLVISVLILDLFTYLAVSSRATDSQDKTGNVIRFDIRSTVNYPFRLSVTTGLLFILALIDPIGSFDVVRQNKLLVNIIIVGVAIMRISMYPFGYLNIVRYANSYVVFTVASIAFMITSFNLLFLVDIQDASIVLKSVVSIFAVLSGIIYGYKWCVSNNHFERIYSVVVGQSSLAFLTFIWAEKWQLFGVYAHLISIVVCVVVIHMNANIIRSTNSEFVRFILACMVFGCQPLTVGFFSIYVLTSSVVDLSVSGPILMTLVVLINVLMMTGAMKIIFPVKTSTVINVPLVNLVGISSIIIPVGISILAGVMPVLFGWVLGISSVPIWRDFINVSGITAVALCMLSMSISIFLWYYRSMIKDFVEYLPKSYLIKVSELTWLYQIGGRVYRSFCRKLHRFAGVLEGQGGVMWALVITCGIYLVING